MANNVKLCICTHTDFDCPVSNPAYEVLDNRKIKIENKLDQAFYSELATHKYATTLRLPKYVGFCQYRRYFEFMDDVPDMDELFKEYDCVVCEPMTFNVDVRAQYARSHNVEDLDIATAIVRDEYPEQYDALVKTLAGNKLYIGNMYIMKREDFRKMMKFVWGVINKLIDKIGTDIPGRIAANPSKYLKGKGANLSPIYQARIGGYVGERLVSSFIMGKFKNIKEYKMVVTGDRAWKV